MDSSLILLGREACRNLLHGLAPPVVLELARSAACLRGRDQHALVGRRPRREAGVGFGINHRDPHPLGPAGVLVCQRKHREGRRHESPPSRSQYAGVVVQEIAPHADSLQLAVTDALGCILARDDIVLLCDTSPALLDRVSTWWRRIAAAALDHSDAVARAAFDSLARLFQEVKSKRMSHLTGDKLIDTEKGKDKDLALFLEMRKREKERNDLLLLHNSDELDPPLGSKPRSAPIFKIVPSAPARKAGVNDFLTAIDSQNGAIPILPRMVPPQPSPERRHPSSSPSLAILSKQRAERHLVPVSPPSPAALFLAAIFASGSSFLLFFRHLPLQVDGSSSLAWVSSKSSPSPMTLLLGRANSILRNLQEVGRSLSISGN